MGSRVELFEQIRRDHDREGLSIRALAERHGAHRRAVRQALASPLPPAKSRPSHDGRAVAVLVRKSAQSTASAGGSWKRASR